MSNFNLHAVFIKEANSHNLFFSKFSWSFTLDQPQLLLLAQKMVALDASNSPLKWECSNIDLFDIIFLTFWLRFGFF